MLLQKLTKKQAIALLDSGQNGEYSPIGRYWYKDDNSFIAIDNSTGNAWVEEFKTLRVCFEYLK